MLGLDDPRWNELAEAYGPATDIPGVLRALERSGRDAALQPLQEGPWAEIWSCLCHQGTV